MRVRIFVDGEKTAASSRRSARAPAIYRDDLGARLQDNYGRSDDVTRRYITSRETDPSCSTRLYPRERRNSHACCFPRFVLFFSSRTDYQRDDVVDNSRGRSTGVEAAKDLSTVVFSLFFFFSLRAIRSQWRLKNSDS